eukprot:9756206-Ditylum_brightwellii.AAC.1
MNKRSLDMPQVHDPHPLGRVESGTDAGVEADTGLQGEGRVTMVHLPLMILVVFYLYLMGLKVLWNQLLMLMKKKTRTQNQILQVDFKIKEDMKILPPISQVLLP